MNNIIRSAVFGILSLSISNTALANAGEPMDGPEQHCYGVAMVGYDSVINSRLGVLPEHALDLAEMQKVGGKRASYQPFLLKVVLDAYLWEKSPHNYAVKVMYNCSMQDISMQTANLLDNELM